MISARDPDPGMPAPCWAQPHFLVGPCGNRNRIKIRALFYSSCMVPNTPGQCSERLDHSTWGTAPAARSSVGPIMSPDLRRA